METKPIEATDESWCVSEAKTDSRFGVKRWSVNVHAGDVTSRGNTVAIVYMGGPGGISNDRAAVEANARLVAASPRLKKMLRQLVFAVATDKDNCLLCDNKDPVNCPACSADAFLAVLDGQPALVRKERRGIPLNGKLEILLKEGASAAGDFRPTCLLPYIEESLTLEENEHVEQFLKWMETNKLKFGHNLPEVWERWRNEP